MLRNAIISVVLLLVTAPPVSAQQNAISLFAYGGFINSPTDFDFGRTVEYSSGFRYGGGLGLQLYEHLGIRVDASLTTGEGTDTSGGINETVSLDRRYFGVAAEFPFPMPSGVEPYLYGGGGFVLLDRTGATQTSYSYDLTEFTAIIGGGLRYRFPSNLNVFVDGTGWLYNRAANDTSQFDKSLSVGLGYRFGTER